MKKHWLRDAAVIGGSTILSLGTIGWHSLKQAEKVNRDEFEGKVVYLNKQKIPLREFYENVSCQNGDWYYQDKNGKNRRIDFISDFIHKKNKIEAKKWIERQKHRYLKIDTIYYQKTEDDGWQTSEGKFVFYHGRVKYKNIPTIGMSNPNGICIRQYEPIAGGKRYQSIDQFNTDLNKTLEHEEEHNQQENPGKDLDNPISMRQIGQSYELSFAQECWGEIFANIKQLLAQHENYIQHDKDLSKITSRFNFYRTALENGTIKSVPIEQLSKKEKKFIADSVYSYWMKDKFPIYYRKFIKRTMDIYRENHANYNATKLNIPRYLRVVKAKSIIYGHDFFPYLIGHEFEILRRISKADKQLFAEDAEKRKARQTHLDDLEATRIEQGYQAYTARIARNADAAQILKKRDYIAEHYACVKRFLGCNR